MSALIRAAGKAGSAGADIAKTTFKNASSFKTMDSLLGVTGKVDVSAILKSMSSLSFVTKLDAPFTGIVKSSGLLKTGKYLTSAVDLVPKSTDDLLSSLSSVAKSSDDILDAGTDVGTTIAKKINTVADSASLKRLDSLADSISATSTSASRTIPGIARRVDDSVSSVSTTLKKLTTSLPPVNKVDDIADTLLDSKGVVKAIDGGGDATMAVVKSSDEVAASAKILAKNADSAASAAKTAKFVKKINKISTLLQVGMVAGYFVGMSLAAKNNASEDDGSNDPLILVTDPGSEIYKVAVYGKTPPPAEDVTSIQDILESTEFMIMVIASIIVVTSIVLI